MENKLKNEVKIKFFPKILRLLRANLVKQYKLIFIYSKGGGGGSLIFADVA